MKSKSSQSSFPVGERWPYLVYFLGWFLFCTLVLSILALLSRELHGSVQKALMAAFLGSVIIAIIVTSVRWILDKFVIQDQEKR